MARAIRRTKLWLWSMIGFACALLFGRDAEAGEAARKYGVRPRPPAPPVPAAADEKPAAEPAPAAEEPDAEQPAPALAESEDWKTVTGAWDFCMPLSESGKSTQAERKEATEKLAAAAEAAARLAAAGLLAEAEAGLLAAEAGKIRRDIHRNPPTDCRVECYMRAYVPPAHQSLERLAQRLPLLEKLAQGGTLHPEAVEKVLATIEADLAVLADAEQVEKLPESRREKAEATRDAARAAADKVGALLAKIRAETAPPADGPKTDRTRPRPTCYKPMPLPVEERKPQSARELGERLSLLDALETGGRLAPETAERARAVILRRIGML